MKHLKRRYLLLLATKLIENTPSPTNARLYCQSYLNRRSRKAVNSDSLYIVKHKKSENFLNEKIQK